MKAVERAGGRTGERGKEAPSTATNVVFIMAADPKTGNLGKHLDRPVLPAPFLGCLAASHVTLADAMD